MKSSHDKEEVAYFPLLYRLEGEDRVSDLDLRR